MKIAVTGATGFVGRHVVAQLLARGHDVAAVARDETRARGLDWFPNVRWIAADVTGPVARPFDALNRPDAVVHLAWSSLGDYADRAHVDEIYPAHRAFLARLVENGLRHLLVTGTCFEYGMQTGCLDEGTPSVPANAYAEGKDRLRRALEALQPDRPFTFQWARLFYMYGDGQRTTSLFGSLERAIAAGHTSFDMSGGAQVRDYLPVEEVASRLVALVERPDCRGVFNVCSGVPISVRDLVQRYVRERGHDIRLNLGRLPYSGHEPMAFWGDSRRFEACCAEPRPSPYAAVAMQPGASMHD